MRNPKFDALLKHMEQLHDKKNSDYADDSNPYSNFEYSAQVVKPFTQDIDKAFVTLISTKLARIAELRKGKTPSNESLCDSFIDLAVYSAIWASMFFNSDKSESGFSICAECKHESPDHAEFGYCMAEGCNCKDFI